MKHFYLIANPYKEGTRQTAEQMQSYLRSCGAACEISVQKKAAAGTGQGYTQASEVPGQTECVITLGGDGTLIQAARDLVDLQIPMLGINLGHLGYLAQVSRDEAVTPMLDALMADNFTLEKRMMLEGQVVGPTGARKGIALNDIVLTRRDVFQVLHFEVSVNGEFLNEYMADGMIAATPTGSTAYNLSAGGPIVAPGAQLTVLTPICSHSLNSRSVVLPPGDRVSIRLLERENHTQTAVFDGDQVVDIGPGDALEITRSPNSTVLIQLKNVSFLENLRRKMARI